METSNTPTNPPDAARVPPPADAPVLWTVEECARYLQRSPRSMYMAVRRPANGDGSIPHTRLPGGAVRFIPEHIRGWVADDCLPAATFKVWNQK